MKITLELQGARYTYETMDGADEGFSSGELIEIFSRMLVGATFFPDVVIPAEGGEYRCEYTPPLIRTGDDEK